jgi:flagellar basal body-associated protein FliL
VKKRTPADRQKRANTGKKRYSVVLEEFSCTLADRQGLQVRIALELFYNNPALKRELLLKRENCKTLVRKVLAGKRLDEIVVDSLRREIIDEINEILERGRIVDVEFKNFLPVNS